MRKIDRIIVHCTDTKPNVKISAILNYWEKIKGWDAPGYHLIIENNGRITQLLDFRYIANGARGFNSNSIHIGYIGRIPNTEILKTLREEIDYLRQVYKNPLVIGHRDLPNVNKTCPNFDVQNWYYGVQ